MSATPTRRRLLAPEVVQTSAMDCGPASLKSLLEGHGISIGYGRLRDACQTEVDGSSIDTMEDIARQLGLDAGQVMVPPAHLLLEESRSLPAIVVVRQPNGFTHFVVLWRVHGPLVQIMDPAVGRRWRTARSLADELYVHRMPVPEAMWTRFAHGDEFLRPLARRLRTLGLPRSRAELLIDSAAADEGWHPLASLDAATRMLEKTVETGALRRRHAAGVLESLYAQVRDESAERCAIIPESFWSVRPAPAEDGVAHLEMRGAVLVRVTGLRERDPEEPPLPESLASALDEPRPRPMRDLFGLLRDDGLLAPLTVLAALAVAAGAVVLEALLFRALFDLGTTLVLPEQRLGLWGTLATFAAALLLLELPLAAGLLRLGRRIELRLRIAFLTKIPRLGDRYFRSRPISDMAERSHSLHSLRGLPELGGQVVRTIAQFLVTLAGILWIDPESWPILLIGGAIVLGLPFLAQPILAEQDLRARTHVGALGRFYLDALLGLIAIRTHGAERSVRREHESLLVEWARASFATQRTAVAIEGLQALAGMTLAATLMLDHIGRSSGGAVLLIAYWGLSLPTLASSLAMAMRQYPIHRNLALRLLEPLAAEEEAHDSPEAAGAESVRPTPASTLESSTSSRTGLTIEMHGVSIVAGGHTILDGIDLSIAAGEHVAVIGPSGAGKSSFAGILLGWHRAASGSVIVDGAPLASERIETLREQTVWLDPAVQLWNRSLIDNLAYGNDALASDAIGAALTDAELRGVLERLPEGLLSRLGEGGGLVSGGEGQRVRLARGMLRGSPRLVILDEPFRGLDRARRRALLERVRAIWKDATLLCITHDVDETAAFERVLVVEGGRIVEDGSPAELLARDGSRFGALLEADDAVRRGAWSEGAWRRMRIESGVLVTAPPAGTPIEASEVAS
ncbi:MAG TPA: ATP-binding cassette domain-containing protein [Candidatus Kapabacteria bacterium]|nr:ATP-binding cassette domain-containing protein [Candidatus Kapabacteria bacterium]